MAARRGAEASMSDVPAVVFSGVPEVQVPIKATGPVPELIFLPPKFN